MATGVPLQLKKSCSKCNKGVGAFSCDGCQQSFCLKHVAEHRQELVSQMESIELEHDLLNEDLVQRTEKQGEHALFERIDQWEKESISKIEQAASESRAMLNCILDNIVDHGKQSLSKISLKLRRAREYDDFFENDLARWKQDLSQLRAEIGCTVNSIKMVDENSASVIKFIKIRHHQTAETTESSWPGNFSWLSDMKSLFYDRPQKALLAEGNAARKFTIQTAAKGSIAIIKVNNADQCIDIENDGCAEHDQNMTGWILRRDADRKTKIIYKFPESFILKSGSTVRISCAQRADMDEKEKVMLLHEDPKLWDVGSSVITYLIDANGEESASVIQTLVPL